MEHTKEPWRVWNHDGDWTIEARSPASGFMVDIANASFSEPDARRIVACVNACEGSETELLEKIGADYSKPLIDLINHAKDLTDQRNELLSALRALYGWQRAEVEHFGATTPDDFIIEMVEKAIKNA